MVIVYYKSTEGFKHADINVWSGILQKDESMIWSYTEQSGFFQKRFSHLFAISNFRIFIFDFKTNKMTGLLMMSDLDDIIVMNTYRASNSTRYSAYGYGISGGQSHGQSVYWENCLPIKW
jgi:hypothetical protein